MWAFLLLEGEEFVAVLMMPPFFPYFCLAPGIRPLLFPSVPPFFIANVPPPSFLSWEGTLDLLAHALGRLALAAAGVIHRR